MIALAPNMDLIDYMAMESMPSSAPFLKTLGKYAKSLEVEYFSQILPNIKRGDCVYNFGGAVLPQYANGGVSTKFWSQGLLYVKSGGYKILYIRATSRITTKMIVGFGGKIVKVVTINEPGVKN